MTTMVSRFKRCGCRDDTGKRLGARCPKLRRANGAWNPAHGTWVGKAEIPAAPDGRRDNLWAGGFRTETELAVWFADALALIDIPDAGPGGHAARADRAGTSAAAAHLDRRAGRRFLEGVPVRR